MSFKHWLQSHGSSHIVQINGRDHGNSNNGISWEYSGLSLLLYCREIEKYRYNRTKWFSMDWKTYNMVADHTSMCNPIRYRYLLFVIFLFLSSMYDMFYKWR